MMKKVKSPLTEGFLLTDARPSRNRSLKNVTTGVAVRFILVAVLVFQCLGGVFADSGPKKDSGAKKDPPPQANPADKVSPDLRDEMMMGRERLVPVIIQTSGNARIGLATAINQSNGFVSKAYQNIDAVAVEVPLLDASALEGDLEAHQRRQRIDDRALRLVLGAAHVDDRADVARHRDLVHGELAVAVDADLGHLREMPGVTEVEREPEPATRGQ